MDLQEILHNSNPWWSKDFKTDFYQREFYMARMRKFLTLPHIVIISGARRVGKTSLLMLTIEELIKKGKNPKNILYFSLDDPLLLAEAGKEKFLDNIFHQYEIIRGKPINKQVIIFIDEVQTISKWPLWLKRYYDQDKIKFIVTGSTASLIKGGHTELTGRSLDLEVFPFNFKEICQYQLGITVPNIKGFDIKEWQKMKIKLGADTKKIKLLFETYIENGGYPEVLKEKDLENRKIILTNYYNQILYRDIVRTFKVKETIILENLALYLLQNIAQKFSFRNIAQVLDTNVETTIKFIGYLTASYLFQTNHFFGTSLKTTLRKDKKFYCLDNGLRNMVVGHKGADKGFLVENLVFNHLRQKFFQSKISFWHNTKKQEVDFIIKEHDFILPIEVKYSDNTLNVENFKGLIDFLQQKKEKIGFILTKDTFKEEVLADNRFLFIPTWLFCLGIVSDL